MVPRRCYLHTASLWAAAILSKKAASLQGSPIQCKYVDQAFKEAQAATLLYLPHYEVMTWPQSVHRNSGDGCLVVDYIIQ